MPLYKPKARSGKNDPYYALYKNFNGVWTRTSTRHTNEKLAQAELLRLQRYASDPQGESQNTATLRDALTLLLDDRESKVLGGKLSQETVGYYKEKGGVLENVLGEDLPLRNLSAPIVDGYIMQRRRDGAKETTIAKELGTWRSAMRLAQRARVWVGDLSVFPIGFSPEYAPRTRFLTEDEVPLYRAVLPPDKFAIVAFSIATSAEWAAIERALPEDISEDFTSCRVRGSKNKNRDRLIPILLLACQALLKEALEKANRSGLLLFRHVGNANFLTDLKEATAKIYPCDCKGRSCTKCKKVHLCCTDLRRTHGKWLRMAGISNDDAAPMMGHADGRMMARVYGKMSPMELAPQLLKQIAKLKEP